MFKIDDKITYTDRDRGITHIGFIREIKKVHFPFKELNDYNLYKVEFEFDSFEWINEMYLVKV